MTTITMQTPLHVQFKAMLSEVANVAMTVDGLYGAFDRAPESISAGPVARVYPNRGAYTMIQNGLVVGAHTVVIEIMTERNFAPKDMEIALPLAPAIATALLENPKLSGVVEGLINLADIQPVRATFEPLTYGGVFGLGWRFEVDYYQQHDVGQITPYTRDMGNDPEYGYVDIVKEISELCQTVNGLQTAFYAPPETVNAFPFAIVYPESSGFQYEDSTTYRVISDYAIEVHAARNDAPIDMDKLVPIGPGVANVLMKNPKLNDAADTIGSVSYTFTTFGYGGIETAGWLINVNGVKQRLNS